MSDEGVVRALERTVVKSNGNVQVYPARILKGSFQKGRRVVMLSKEGKGVLHKVARVVCTAFHGPCPKGHECSHLDGDCSNDRADNLEWETPKYNQKRKRDHGTWGIKLDEDAVMEIRRRYRDGEKGMDLAKEFQVGSPAISNIVNGRTWAWLPVLGQPLIRLKRRGKGRPLKKKKKPIVAQFERRDLKKFGRRVTN